MKKLALILFLLFVIVFPKSIALADESSASAAVSPTPMQVNYTLPYPGILPDNPLYFFKTLRDNIVTFFISDPLKKSSFYLLQSDKRLEASWYLLKNSSKNLPLALTTLSKSNNYFELALSQEKQAKASGEDVVGLVDQLKSAAIVHAQVVKDMATLPGVSGKSLAGETVRVNSIVKSVSQLSAK